MRFVPRKSPIFVIFCFACWRKIMTMKKAMARLLESDAEKAEARVVAAKQQVRSAKATLKRARKLFKAEKKAAKQARKKAAAAIAATRRPRPAPAGKASARKRPAVRRRAVKQVRAARNPRRAPKARRTAKPRASSPGEYMRSAADVAKLVVNRLQSSALALSPEPAIAADLADPKIVPEVKP